MLMLGLQIHITEAIDENQVNATVNKNCSRFIAPQQENFRSAVKSHFTNMDESMCPPWYSKGKNKCEKGAMFEGIVIFERRILQTWLQMFYCMTTLDENATNRTDAIGGCLYLFHVHKIGTYYPLPCNISKLMNTLVLI